MNAYASYCKDNFIRAGSSSGGVYPLLARWVIQKGGIVYASAYVGTDVHHVRVTDLEGIPATCGSKYVPSKLGNTFSEIKADLTQGRTVLFVGTPCQCAGLLSVTGDHPNLICVDFVCHGIPSQKVWDTYRDALAKRGPALASVNMRDKSSGWSRYGYSWKLTDQKGNVQYQKNTENLYMQGFLKDFYLRPSCYQCKFKGLGRKTDFTLGDYWGVWELQPEMDDNQGTSLVLVHTEKGQAFFEAIQENLVWKAAPIEAAAQYNPSLLTCANEPSRRTLFFKKLQQGEDFFRIMDALTKPSVSGRIRHMLKKLLFHA